MSKKNKNIEKWKRMVDDQQGCLKSDIHKNLDAWYDGPAWNVFDAWPAFNAVGSPKGRKNKKG